MTVQVQPLTCIWPFYDLQLNESDNLPVATGVFFQHSFIVKQWHGLSAVGTLTEKGLRYLLSKCFLMLFKFSSVVGFEFLGHSLTFPGY